MRVYKSPCTYGLINMKYLKLVYQRTKDTYKSARFVCNTDVRDDINNIHMSIMPSESKNRAAVINKLSLSDIFIIAATRNLKTYDTLFEKFLECRKILFSSLYDDLDRIDRFIIPLKR